MYANLDMRRALYRMTKDHETLMGSVGHMSVELDAARTEARQQATRVHMLEQEREVMHQQMESLLVQLQQCREQLETSEAVAAAAAAAVSSTASGLPKCIACNVSTRNVRFTCGHVCMCSGCVPRMSRKQCPLCKRPFTKTLSVMLS